MALVARRWFAATAVVCVTAVGIAFTLQHQYGYQPCPWCILQRVIFLGIALAAVLGILWRSALGSRCACVVMLLLALCGAAAALWQHFVAAAEASCNLTLAEKIVAYLGLDERWPAMFTAYASCKEAAARLLGVPFEFYSLALYLVTIVLAVTWLRHGGAKRRR